ncbi:unnamed protein product, partial [Rotaria sp. Silwood2]
TLISKEKSKQIIDENIIQKIIENQLNMEQEENNDEAPTEKG